MVIEQHWNDDSLYVSGDTSSRWAVEWNDTFTKEEVATLTYRWDNDHIFLCLLNEYYASVDALYSICKQLNMREVQLGPRLQRTFIDTEEWRPTVFLFMQLLEAVDLGSYGIELTGGRLEQA